MMSSTPSKNSCASCCHFCNQPDYLERAIPGLSSMSSAYASVRGEDGICAKHDRYLSARSYCSDYLVVKTSR
jgi:hypothetical protein